MVRAQKERILRENKSEGALRRSVYFLEEFSFLSSNQLSDRLGLCINHFIETEFSVKFVLDIMQRHAFITT